MEREYNDSREREPEQKESAESGAFTDARSDAKQDCEPKARRGLRLDFLRDIAIDDLILIGIGLLLLLDSDGENDLFVLVIAFLLFF
ncbi:MAG: hypothetical protein J6Q72_01605 [Clostridia bacterium]|nr:hypothetical protein [Clostridia bacterium]